MNTVKLQVGQVSIEVSGDENFVKQQFESLSEKYISLAHSSQTSEVHRVSNATDPADQPSILTKVGTNKYLEAGIYSVDADSKTVQIHSEIPGNSKLQKMKNIALIIAYAKNEEEIPMKDISAECKRQGCFDQGNFATSIKNDTRDFQIRGKGQGRTIKISVPGKKAAENILDKMLDDESNRCDV